MVDVDRPKKLKRMQAASEPPRTETPEVDTSRGLAAIANLMLALNPRVPPARRAFLMRHPDAGPRSTAGIAFGIVWELGLPATTVAEFAADQSHVVLPFLAEMAGARGILVARAQHGFPSKTALPEVPGVARVPGGLDVAETALIVRNLASAGTALDVLILNIGGEEYRAWQAIEARPGLMIVSFNANLGFTDALVISNTIPVQNLPENLAVDGGQWAYGASLAALEKLGKSKGYKLIGINQERDRAFFLPEGDTVFPPYTTADLFMAGIKHGYVKSPVNARKLRTAGIPIEEV